MKKLGYALCAMALAAAAATAQKKIDEKLPAQADGSVLITNIAGSVKVSGWDREEVAVTGTLASNVERLDFTSEGRRTVVEVVMRKGSWIGKGETELEVRLPSGSNLEVGTISAKIEVEGIEGKLRLESESGRITASGNPLSFYLRSTSGKIDISASGSGGRAQTISGDISIQDSGGDIEVISVSGAIRVKGGLIGNASLETTSGRIRFEADLEKGARIDASSTSGSVELSLPADLAADFDLSSFSGGIENEFRPESDKAGKGPGRSVTFSTGNDARVVAKSFSGKIVLLTH